jgi:hypothetical protein
MDKINCFKIIISIPNTKITFLVEKIDENNIRGLLIEIVIVDAIIESIFLIIKYFLAHFRFQKSS